MLGSHGGQSSRGAASRRAAGLVRPVSSGPGRPGQLRAISREIAVVVFAAAVYGAVRAVTEGRVARAVANAEAVEPVERTLGIGWEHAVSRSMIGSTALVTLANWVYIWGHWPVIIVAASLLYLRTPITTASSETRSSSPG